MSPQDELTLAERDRQQAQAAQSLYLSGVTDAAIGSNPASTEPAYLDGYLKRLRERIEEGRYTLVIRWLSPAYVTGHYDSPDECRCEEF